jgi:hypothetical protein
MIPAVPIRAIAHMAQNIPDKSAGTFLHIFLYVLLS